jgi:CRISPR-associated protein Cas2
MTARRQLIVFCYDVSKATLRDKMARVLERFGTRVQESVFECRMTMAEAERLFRQLDLVRDPDDGLRMYVIPEDARALARAVGGAPISEKTEFWLL